MKSGGKTHFTQSDAERKILLATHEPRLGRVVVAIARARPGVAQLSFVGGVIINELEAGEGELLERMKENRAALYAQIAKAAS